MECFVVPGDEDGVEGRVGVGVGGLMLSYTMFRSLVLLKTKTVT